MGTQLKDALEAAGMLNLTSTESPADKPLYHEVFEFPLTKFEIPILIKVRCDRKEQGLQAIARHKLNSIEADNFEDAKEKVNQALCKWSLEPNTGIGMIKYWRFYHVRGE